MSIPILAALGAYAIAILSIALASLRSGTTAENFLVAGRKQRKLLVVASMLASTVGGGITIGTIQKASVMGFPAFWFVAAGGMAHLLQGLLLSRKVRESEALTMADLADKTAGAEARLLTSIIVLVTWIGIAAAQFSAAARVLSTLVGLSHPTGVAIAAVFIVVYTLIGGQKSVLRTDLFQAGLLAIAVVATAAYLYIAKPPASPVRIDIFTEKFGPLDLVYYVVVLGGSYFICPMMFSRILSADTPANARKSSFLSGAGMFGFALVLTFIGLWVSASGFQVGKLDPLNAIAKSALPPALGVLLVMGLLAAIVSTGDTVILTASSIAANDLLKKPSVAAIRLLTVIIGAVAAAIALFQSDVIVLLVKTYNGYTAGLVPALFVSIMYARFSGGVAAHRPSPLVFAAAIVSGYALGVAGSFAPIDTTAAKLLPLAGMVASAVLALISYREKGKNA